MLQKKLADDQFFPLPDFSFPTFRLSDFFRPLSGSPDVLLLYNSAPLIHPDELPESDELRRVQWPCSATFGAVNRDRKCHLH
jgi:hypothetical protein